jgi:hypothetical protein
MELCYMACCSLADFSFFLNRFYSKAATPFENIARLLYLVKAGCLIDILYVNVQKKLKRLNFSVKTNQLMRQRRHGLDPDSPNGVGCVVT